MRQVVQACLVPRHIRCPCHLPQKYQRALVVLPYVSIVCEKSAHLEAVLKPMGASVKGFFGGEEGQALGPRWAERFCPRPCPCHGRLRGYADTEHANCACVWPQG